MGSLISISREVADNNKPMKMNQGLIQFISTIIRRFILRQLENLSMMKRALSALIRCVTRCFFCMPRKSNDDGTSTLLETPQMVIEKGENGTSNSFLQQEEMSQNNAEAIAADDDDDDDDECVEEEQLLIISPTRQEEVTKGVVSEERWLNHYSSFQKILLVGEGDFSFSASLAMAFGSATNMVATSLDSQEFLEKNYQLAMSNIRNLTARGCRVIHGVSVKKMAEHPLLKGMAFDRVVYNFPYAGFFKTESRESQLGRHRRLVGRFMRNAKEMMSEGGEIHVTHKTNAFHNEWNIEQLASCHGLCVIETMGFDYTDYAGYRPKRGFGGDKNFDCKPCMTYKFGPRNPSTEKKKRKKRNKCVFLKNK